MYVFGTVPIHVHEPRHSRNPLFRMRESLLPIDAAIVVNLFVTCTVHCNWSGIKLLLLVHSWNTGGEPELILFWQLSYIASSACQWCLCTISLYGSTFTNNMQAL